MLGNRTDSLTCKFRLLREARDACTILDGKAREDCYSSFGCDGNRVEQYLDTVVDLEAHLPKGPDLPGESPLAPNQGMMPASSFVTTCRFRISFQCALPPQVQPLLSH